MVDLMFFVLLVFFIFHYYIIILISNHQYEFLSFFWRHTSLFRYSIIMLNIFYFICNSLWTSLWHRSGDVCNFMSNFMTNQITSCFSRLLNCSFWSIFKCICSRVFSRIIPFLAKFTSDACTSVLAHISSKRQKLTNLTNIRSLCWTEYHISFYIFTY